MTNQTVEVEVGNWDSQGQVVKLSNGSTVRQAFEQAGIRVNPQESVSSMSSNRTVGLDEPIQDGEQYIITRNHVSGN